MLSARDAAGAAVAAIVVEVQRHTDHRKRFVWPQYLASVHARQHCATWLVVLTGDRQVAAWARQPIATFHPGSDFAPLVLAPDDVPRIVTEEDAAATPELAVLSALFHREDDGAIDIVRAALGASARLDVVRAGLYFDLIFATLPEIAVRALEGLMESGKYEYRSEFARKYFAQGRENGREEGHQRGREAGLRDGREEGREEGREQALDEVRADLRADILQAMSGRAIAVDPASRARLEAETDLRVLRKWLLRAVTARTFAELLDAEG